jgi:hypothetical protein
LPDSEELDQTTKRPSYQWREQDHEFQTSPLYSPASRFADTEASCNGLHLKMVVLASRQNKTPHGALF